MVKNVFFLSLRVWIACDVQNIYEVGRLVLLYFQLIPSVRLNTYLTTTIVFSIRPRVTIRIYFAIYHFPGCLEEGNIIITQSHKHFAED